MIEKLQDSRAVLLGAVAIFAFGLTTSGYALGDGLRRSKMAEHGRSPCAASRNATSPPISRPGRSGSRTRATDLARSSSRSTSRRARCAHFSSAPDFRPEDVTDSDVSLSREQPRDKDGRPVGPQKLTVSRSIQLRTNDVMKARAAYTRQAELLRDGVELVGSNISYTFTGLNALKPRDDRRGHPQRAPQRRAIRPRQRRRRSATSRRRARAISRSARATARSATIAARRAAARRSRRSAS